MELCARNGPVNYGNVHVNLRVRVKESDHLIAHRPASVHHIEAHFGMADEHVLQQQRVADSSAIFG